MLIGVFGWSEDCEVLMEMDWKLKGCIRGTDSLVIMAYLFTWEDQYRVKKLDAKDIWIVIKGFLIILQATWLI